MKRITSSKSDENIESDDGHPAFCGKDFFLQQDLAFSQSFEDNVFV